MNDDTLVCPVTRTLVQDDGVTDMTTYQKSLISIDVSGKVSINESVFDGQTVVVKVKGITRFNEAVYKKITVSDRCASQPTQLKNNGESIIYVERKEASALDTKMSVFYTNTDESDCHYNHESAFSLF